MSGKVEAESRDKENEDFREILDISVSNNARVLIVFNETKNYFFSEKKEKKTDKFFAYRRVFSKRWRYERKLECM